MPGRPRFEGLRYRVWGWLCRRTSVCPATSHGRIVYGDREAPLRITPSCLYEDPTVGCWCGKLSGARSEGVAQ